MRDVISCMPHKLHLTQMLQPVVGRAKYLESFETQSYTFADDVLRIGALFIAVFEMVSLTPQIALPNRVLQLVVGHLTVCFLAKPIPRFWPAEPAWGVGLGWADGVAIRASAINRAFACH